LVEEVVLYIVSSGVVLGGFVLIAMTLASRQRLRELAVKERIAMIEKGLVPSPELDPARFERLVGAPRRPANSRSMRYRSAGVVLIGLGLALMVLLVFAAGVAAVGIGIGGGFAVLGAAVYFNGVLLARDEAAHFYASSRENRMPEPPPNVGP
jgi:hypothetical protein